MLPARHLFPIEGGGGCLKSCSSQSQVAKSRASASVFGRSSELSPAVPLTVAFELPRSRGFAGASLVDEGEEFHGARTPLP